MNREQYKALDPIVRAAFTLETLFKLGHFKYGMKPRPLTDAELEAEAKLPPGPMSIQ